MTQRERERERERGSEIDQSDREGDQTDSQIEREKIKTTDRQTNKDLR
jgi:hypothetical protein